MACHIERSFVVRLTDLQSHFFLAKSLVFKSLDYDWGSGGGKVVELPKCLVL